MIKIRAGIMIIYGVRRFEGRRAQGRKSSAQLLADG
jgi:hypothetical protein